MATPKEQMWLIEYLQCWNATEAARRAGYKWPNKKGPEKKLKFTEEIQQHIEDKAMSADEVLIRLAEQARGNLGDFADIDTDTDIKDHPQSHLLKKVTIHRYTTKDKIRHHKVLIELYDAQAALVHIGKHHGLFREQLELTGKVELDVSSNEILEKVYGDNSDT